MAGVTGERVVPEDTYFLEEVDDLFVAAVFPFREEELLVAFCRLAFREEELLVVFCRLAFREEELLVLFC